MFKSGFRLTTDAHLHADMFNKTDVIVWIDNEIVDFGGRIEAVTDNIVTINGERYLKVNCEFKVR